MQDFKMNIGYIYIRTNEYWDLYDAFKLGKTLGDGNTHWYRAKFYQQYRLFFRFNSRAKIIVYAWVNDTKTKRAYESKSDAYLIFQKMLKRNRPPSDWDELVKFSDPI